MAVISNYVPEEEVTCYTLPDSNENEPKLPSELAQPVHKFIMMVLLLFIFNIGNIIQLDYIDCYD